MHARLTSRAHAEHAEPGLARRLESVLLSLPNGCLLEVLRETLQGDADTDIRFGLRTVNLRPVPRLGVDELIALLARTASATHRLHDLSRSERHCLDLLDADDSGQFSLARVDDLLRIAIHIRGAALQDYAEGDLMAPRSWLALGARFAQHHMPLDPESGGRIWRSIDAARHESVPTEAWRLPATVAAAVDGCVKAQDRALQGRTAAMEALALTVATARARSVSSGSRH